MVLCKWHMANTVNGKNMPVNSISTQNNKTGAALVLAPKQEIVHTGIVSLKGISTTAEKMLEMERTLYCPCH